MTNKKVTLILASVLIILIAFVGLRVNSYNKYRATIKPFYEHASLGLTMNNIVVSYLGKHPSDSISLQQGIINLAEKSAKELEPGKAHDEQIALINFLKNDKIRIVKEKKAVCIYYDLSSFFSDSENETSNWDIKFPEFIFLRKNILLAKFTLFSL